jgi:molybdate transport system substrate-binding protein
MPQPPCLRSGIGMAVRAGAPKPDISTVEAFTRALLQARSIAYSAQVSGLYLANELFPRLGIADQVRSKSQVIERERVGAVVARGEAEVGFQQVSERRSRASSSWARASRDPAHHPVLGCYPAPKPGGILALIAFFVSPEGCGR